MDIINLEKANKLSKCIDKTKGIIEILDYKLQCSRTNDTYNNGFYNLSIDTGDIINNTIYFNRDIGNEELLCVILEELRKQLQQMQEEFNKI